MQNKKKVTRKTAGIYTAKVTALLNEGHIPILDNYALSIGSDRSAVIRMAVIEFIKNHELS